MKRCYRCKETKPIEEMSATTGFCKPCKKEYTKEYNLKNKERNAEYRRTYVEKNKEVMREKAKKYVSKPQCKETRKAYKEKNKEKIRIARAEYNSRPKIQEKREQYRKKYNQENIEKLREIRRDYVKVRSSTDIEFKIKMRLRNRLYDALGRSYTKSATTLALLGCDVVFLRAHLESKFLPTMTWDNYGKLWHIDHILPCASFDLSDPEQQNKCFHYSNLQPLFAITTVIDGIEYIGNINKGDKIIQLAA